MYSRPGRECTPLLCRDIEVSYGACHREMIGNKGGNTMISSFIGMAGKGRFFVSENCLYRDAA